MLARTAKLLSLLTLGFVFALVLSGALWMAVGAVTAPERAIYSYDSPAATTATAHNVRTAALRGEPTPARGEPTPAGRLRSPTSSIGPSLAAKAAPRFIGPVRQSSHQIGHGHAYGKHVVERGEFPGISSPDQFARHIESVVTNPTAFEGAVEGSGSVLRRSVEHGGHP